jgi:hypothetical protein
MTEDEEGCPGRSRNLNISGIDISRQTILVQQVASPHKSKEIKMKRLFSTKKRIAASVLVVAIIAATGGIAAAYWTQGGTGTGTAATGTTSNVTVNQTTVVTGLYPGDTPVTLSGNFNNPNLGPVKVGTVSAVLDASLPAGCVAADFTVAGTDAVNAEIASGSAVGSWTGITIKMNDTLVNQDACKSATGVTIDYTVSAAA